MSIADNLGMFFRSKGVGGIWIWRWICRWIYGWMDVDREVWMTMTTLKGGRAVRGHCRES